MREARRRAHAGIIGHRAPRSETLVAFVSAVAVLASIVSVPTSAAAATSTDGATIVYFVKAGSRKVISEKGKVRLKLPARPDALAIRGKNTYVSFPKPIRLKGKRYDDSDIVRFRRGKPSMFFDGSTIGLRRRGEDIDAIDVLPGGRIMFSVVGKARMKGGVRGRDEDVFLWDGSKVRKVFDGSKNGLRARREDVNAFAALGDTFFFSTNGRATRGSFSAGDEDLFTCAASCSSFKRYFNRGGKDIVAADVVMKIKGAVSMRDGRWSDPGVWSTGRTPRKRQKATVRHAVTFDPRAARVRGLTVQRGGKLTFTPNASHTLKTNKNLVLKGRLTMKPATPSDTHVVRFVGVKEHRFKGGGFKILNSDVGLWAVGKRAKLDVAGAAKTAWTRAGPLSAGATTLTLEEAPSGWRAGDELAISPTLPPGSSSHLAFDEAKVVSVSGSTVTIDRPLSHAHPVVNGLWGAEVLNLTRNVRIEGTPNGKSHILLMKGVPKQNISYAAIRWMGPRKKGSDPQVEAGVPGRYGLHFHATKGSARGSLVAGTVVRDTDAHAYVPHETHGLTFRDTISYNTADTAYWYDPGPGPNELVIERAVAAKVRAIPSFRGFTLTGFHLAQGQGNEIKRSVAVGVQGNSNASGMAWPADGVGIWRFDEGNVSHNNKIHGTFTWQNSQHLHIVSDLIAYHNGEYGVFHGAYRKAFVYKDSVLYGNGKAQMLFHAVSRPDVGLSRIDRTLLDGAGTSRYNVVVANNVSEAEFPLEIRESSFHGAQRSDVRVEGKMKGWADVVDSGLGPEDISFVEGAADGSKVRLQQGGEASLLLPADSTTGGTEYPATNVRSFPTSVFAFPTLGTGMGATLTYFDAPNLSRPVATVRDPILYHSWGSGNDMPHPYLKRDGKYGARWTGSLEAPSSDTFTFFLFTHGGVRVWLDDKLMVDRWTDPFSQEAEFEATLVEGQRYPLRVEYFQRTGYSSISLRWRASPLPSAVTIPSTQLHDTQG